MSGDQKNINGQGIARLKRAFFCSVDGMKAAWANETAFRQELIICGVLFPAALVLGNTGVERALLIGSLMLVLVVELLNSAVEAVVDRIGLERHRLSGLAKDLGSAAVTLSLVHGFLIWLLVLFF